MHGVTELSVTELMLIITSAAPLSSTSPHPYRESVRLRPSAPTQLLLQETEPVWFNTTFWCTLREQQWLPRLLKPPTASSG